MTQQNFMEPFRQFQTVRVGLPILLCMENLIVQVYAAFNWKGGVVGGQIICSNFSVVTNYLIV